MKILMCPGRMRAARNNYIDIIVRELISQGAHVEHWTPYKPFQRGDIFHVHWPEIIPARYQPGPTAILAKWCEQNFWNTIKAVKRCGGAVVWTAHNITPHGLTDQGRSAWSSFIERFIANLDCVLYLTAASETAMKLKHPSLASIPSRVVRHPHYADIMPPPSSRDYRAEWGVGPKQRIFAHIGVMSRLKGVAELAKAFSEQSEPDDVLLLAGHAPEDLKREIYAATEGCKSKVILRFEWLSDQEVVDMHKASNIICFFGRNYLNSGTILQALSMNRPVAALNTPWITEITNLVGNSFIISLNDNELISGINGYRIDSIGSPDLSAFSPVAIGKGHIDAYMDTLRVNN